MKQLETRLERQREHLRSLLVMLRQVEGAYEKLEILNSLPEVDVYFSFPSPLKTFLSGVTPECEYVIKATFAIGQGPRLFEWEDVEEGKRLRFLLEDLLILENFYRDMGGIIGYHHLVLTLLGQETSGEEVDFHPPVGIDLRQENSMVKEAILKGIENQGKMAELYPVGGAADRLQLKDEKTEEGLPAARLVFLGKPLLEGVINDLQAREYLHYKLFDGQIITPIGMMTSHVNRNHDHIKEICAQNQWFGRPQESFRFFSQPSVPTFTREGNWCLQKPLKLLLKPGGHGMLWKLLRQSGVFTWLKERGSQKALVRQINNPMAAIDYGLLAFVGLGHQGDKGFGFASCPRLVNAQEGMNVVKQKSGKEVLSNIEYCDFKKCGIEDEPFEKGGKYSRFPSNTNILFADLEEIERVSKKFPNPGLLVNFRKGHHYHSPNKKEEIARLETTMQNIADGLSALKGEDLPTYLTFNKRRKTISTTKKKLSAKGEMLETPEGCYYDYMLNAKELLETHCQMSLPTFPNELTFAKEGPSFLFSYHPALGPLYSIIRQKVQGGSLADGAELQLDIADLYLKNLNLEGSLLIHATDVMGHKEKELLKYSEKTGQCVLDNVHVMNEGINWEEDHLFWRHDVKRHSSLTIILYGHSRFIAKDLKISGDLSIKVPHGMQITAEEENGRVIFITKPLEDTGPFWTYSVDTDHSIEISSKLLGVKKNRKGILPGLKNPSSQITTIG